MENAVDFFFLNKTCFNGLFRVNQTTGDFNSPFAHRNQRIIDKVVFLEAVEALKKVRSIDLADFEETLKQADQNSIVYLDPPYMPYDDIEFTHQRYTKEGFDLDDTERLLSCMNWLDDLGAKVIISQSYSEVVKDFLMSKLNSHFSPKVINFHRSMDNKVVAELIISNVTPKEFRKSFLP